MAYQPAGRGPGIDAGGLALFTLEDGPSSLVAALLKFTNFLGQLQFPVIPDAVLS